MNTPENASLDWSQKACAKRILGYVRVSTADQTVRAQEDALIAAGCERIFGEEPMSGGTTARPALDELLAELHAGDTLCVVAVSRLGRSMLHTVRLMLELDARGVIVKSLEGFDTRTAIGRTILSLFAGFAEIEHAAIRDRTSAYLQAKKRRGEPLGRPRATTKEQDEHLVALIAGGESKRRAARILGIDRATAYRILARQAQIGC
ncbi:MAG TPA: recombinase family protein [Candidatus Cybelea sp.]|jgi:DNA invertase Pin-like site-specific DNA recombinase